MVSLDGVYPHVLVIAGKHEGLFEQIVNYAPAIGWYVEDTTTVSSLEEITRT